MISVQIRATPFYLKMIEHQLMPLFEKQALKSYEDLADKCADIAIEDGTDIITEKNIHTLGYVPSPNLEGPFEVLQVLNQGIRIFHHHDYEGTDYLQVFIREKEYPWKEKKVFDFTRMPDYSDQEEREIIINDYEPGNWEEVIEKRFETIKK